eukprot:CCRYP_015765-RA/>CCRYP_015765-RA protein AED:0.46 eAED:0.57 QI:0/0/0/1/1/1/2/0/214
MNWVASAKALAAILNINLYQDIPNQCKSDNTYTRVVCKIGPPKADPCRTQITRGVTASAWFALFDISNFYLGTPLDRPEYASIKLTIIPDNFVQEYGLRNFVHNRYNSFEVTKGVYCLKQAGKLANDLLTQLLETYGYCHCTTTPGLWRHKWRPVIFVLIVNDFGIQYTERRHAEHLLHALQEHYTTGWAPNLKALISNGTTPSTHAALPWTPT